MKTLTASPRTVLPDLANLPDTVNPTTAAWLEIVAAKASGIRFGVIQITIHDSKIVQIERTERVRFAPPQRAA